MKKIINGKLYNTETAQSIGYWCNTGNTRDFSYVSEELYRKRTGEFFLFGEGGPMSKYSRSIGNNEWSGGEEITPLTWEAARRWAEEHLDVEEYEACFGETPEDDGTEILSLSLPATTAAKARRAASMEGVSLSQWISTLIDKKFELSGML